MTENNKNSNFPYVRTNNKIADSFGPMKLVVLTVALLILPIWASAQDSEVPKGWKRVKSCTFSFILPRTARELKTRPIDSCVARFEYEDLSLSLDYGLYSSPLSQMDWMTKYRKEPITINGLEGNLISYKNAMDPKSILYVTNVHIVASKSKSIDWGDRSLLMSITSESSKHLEAIKQIYESLTFLEKK